MFECVLASCAYLLPISYQQLKTPTGYMNVSTHEMTAFDLVRYVKSAGYLNHVATILSELQEKFDLTRFTQLRLKIWIRIYI